LRIVPIAFIHDKAEHVATWETGQAVAAAMIGFTFAFSAPPKAQRR
jgi:hypothetical protein